MAKLKIIECPRDAMQGIKNIIPTENKIKYINSLLKVGFDTIDFGSFVSPKAIPQMKDTRAVLEGLDHINTESSLLAIIANLRGAHDAASYDAIEYLGYPFSISETFQLRNTNASIQESLQVVRQIRDICLENDKKLVIYISMAFGNPYGDIWNLKIVEQWVDNLLELDVQTFALSDTIGVATPESIEYLFSRMIPQYPTVEFGAHLHTTPDSWEEKVRSAYQNGCRRFDGALMGYGGCPMAKEELTGNMPTEKMIQFFQNQEKISLHMESLQKSLALSSVIFA